VDVRGKLAQSVRLRLVRRVVAERPFHTCLFYQTDVLFYQTDVRLARFFSVFTDQEHRGLVNFVVAPAVDRSPLGPSSAALAESPRLDISVSRAFLVLSIANAALFNHQNDLERERGAIASAGEGGQPPAVALRRRARDLVSQHADGHPALPGLTEGIAVLTKVFLCQPVDVLVRPGVHQFRAASDHQHLFPRTLAIDDADGQPRVPLEVAILSRPCAVLNVTFSPSWSTQTVVVWGEPSVINVVTTPYCVSSRSPFCFSVSFSAIRSTLLPCSVVTCPNDRSYAPHRRALVVAVR